MDTPETIVENAEYHARLLSTIRELEYVSQAKKHQVSYIKDLEGQIEAGKKKVAQLAEKTKKERKEHEVLRDSTARRFAHKLVGKKEIYAAKESKEEREYVEALEREMTERDNHNVVTQLLDEAKGVLIDLKEKEIRHESAQAELQALYGRVFDGPTRSFPEDDRLEYDLDAAVKRHEKVQSKLNSESRAAELLARAVRSMDLCQQNVQEALGYSRYDMWGGGSMADMMERNALRNAQVNASQVEMLVDQAIRVCPTVQPVGRVNIAQGSIVSDVFFDNIFTDMAFHDKIKQSAAQVLLANQRLKVERDSARRRSDAAGAELMKAAKELDARRTELDGFRRATFESYVAQHPPPPSYDIITSPTTATAPPGGNPNFPMPNLPAPTAEPSNSMNVDGDHNSNASMTSSPQPPRSPPQVQLQVGEGMIRMPEARPSEWGTRNPYAYAMSERTRKMSD